MAQGNCKAFYHFINYQTKEKSDISGLSNEEGEIVMEPSTMCNILNNYFSSVFSCSANVFPHVPQPISIPINVTTNGVIEMIKNLKYGKAPGPDGFRKEDLMIDVDVMADTLASFFRYSINIGVLPKRWKLAYVVPIFKGGDKHLASNYRPVSLTSVCCKLLEHILVTHIRTTVDSWLHSNQRGFRRGLSCTTQLAAVAHHIGSLVDKKECVQAVVLDFAKAFDKVPHDKLVRKLLDIRLDLCSVKWIADFLSDRTQEVVLQGERSVRLSGTSVVPQGSVLGPVLLSVCINLCLCC
jgi:hypothetical protein